MAIGKTGLILVFLSTAFDRAFIIRVESDLSSSVTSYLLSRVLVTLGAGGFAFFQEEIQPLVGCLEVGCLEDFGEGEEAEEDFEEGEGGLHVGNPGVWGDGCETVGSWVGSVYE